MSVILDALHKARGDRRNPAAAEPHEQTVARVVDAGLAPQNVFSGDAPARTGGGRGLFIGLAVLCGTVLLVALVGGAFFLLYDQMRRIETVATKPAAAPIAAPVAPPTAMQSPAQPAAAPAAVPPAALLQTPVPLTELPVQAPAMPVATVANAKPNFELGSIVCENSDCLASLNGRSVRVGDTVKGYHVTKIDSTSITLKSEANGSEVTLSLFD